MQTRSAFCAKTSRLGANVKHPAFRMGRITLDLLPLFYQNGYLEEVDIFGKIPETRH